MKKAIALAAALFAACWNAPASAGPNLPTKPIEQKYYADGAWTVAQTFTPAGCDSKGNPCDIFYPANLGANGFHHPIIVWANGSGTTPIPATTYAYLLHHLASWGFVVIATRDGTTGTGQTVLDSANYIKARNADSGSIFYGKLDTTRIGAMGHSQGASGAQGAAGVDSGGDFSHAGHENQYVALRAGIHNPLHDVGGLLRNRSLIVAVEITHLHRKTLPLRNQDGAGDCGVRREIIRHRFRIQRGRHDRDLQVRPPRLLESLHQRECDVAQQVALMKFVEQNDPHVPQRTVVLQPAQQNPLRHKANPRAQARLVVETDLVTNFSAQFYVAFPRHPRGHLRLFRPAHEIAARKRVELLILPSNSAYSRFPVECRYDPAHRCLSLALAAGHNTIRPALGFVGADSVGDQLQFRFLVRSLSASIELVRA